MYSFNSRVRYSETDSEERLTLQAITDYFQDCSTFQSEDLGLGVRYLQQKDLVWVLSAWQIIVEETPVLGENIKISTFPYAFKSFMGYRNFILEGENGKRYAYASSLWTLLNRNEMHPTKLTDEMKEKYVLEEKLPMEYASRKIICSGDGMKEDVFPVKKVHLDSNYHVNNGQYVRMASAYLPEGAVIRQMRAEYKKQAVLGNMIHPVIYQPEAAVIAVSLNNDENEPYAIVEFSLR